jgi:hypothetical protein
MPPPGALVATGTVTSPAVTLSPNARNLVRVSVAMRLTTTGNVHAAAVFRASTAWQATVVMPTWNTEPENGEQVTVTGAWPPLVVGAGNVTATLVAVVEATTPVGHVPVNVPGGGVGGGDVGVLVPPQETTRSEAIRGRNRAVISSAIRF